MSTVRGGGLKDLKVGIFGPRLIVFRFDDGRTSSFSRELMMANDNVPWVHVVWALGKGL